MKDKFELVVVERAEFAEAFLDLLHYVHILGRLGVHCHIALIGCGKGGVCRAFIRFDIVLWCLLVGVVQIGERSPTVW